MAEKKNKEHISVNGLQAIGLQRVGVTSTFRFAEIAICLYLRLIVVALEISTV